MYPMQWNILRFDEVDSTNQVALNYPIYTAITADHQTAGRGRLNRVWESVKGNLYLSMVLPEIGDKTPMLAFVVGVAVAGALKEFNVRLKWPNDVLEGGKKIAGILLERADDKVIVGIGVNITSAPSGNLMYPVGDLAGKTTVAQVTQRILDEMEKGLAEFETNGFESVRRKWLSVSYFHEGDKMRVRLPHETFEGTFGGIDENGILLLKQEGGKVIRVSAGDVFKI